MSAIAYIGNKIEADASSEDRFHRRDILKCVGATICVVRAFSSLLFIITSLSAYAAFSTMFLKRGKCLGL